MNLKLFCKKLRSTFENALIGAVNVIFFPSILCRIDLSYRQTRPALMDYLFVGCSECVALQDPYCAWNAATSRCVTVASVVPTAQSSLIQSIFTGYSDQCPDNGKTKQVFTILHSSNYLPNVFFFAIFQIAIVKAKNRTPLSPLTETIGKNFVTQIFCL